MSLDYPNRKHWLAVRATPQRKPKGRYFHVSKTFWFKKGVTYERTTPRVVHGRGRARRAAA